MDRATQDVMVQAEYDEWERQAREARALRIYRIIRFRESGRKRVIRNNVTLAEAQAHCSDPKTRGVRGGVRWFDGYDYMPGCRPDTRGD